METPAQVIAKIRNAPDDAAAMAVLKECGYELKAAEGEEGPKVEVEFGMETDPRKKFIKDRLEMARGA